MTIMAKSSGLLKYLNVHYLITDILGFGFTTFPGFYINIVYISIITSEPTVMT